MAHRLVAEKIGRFAREAICYGENALVTGVTSRGRFIQIDNHWIVFLSTQSFCGPLTVNLSWMPGMYLMPGMSSIPDILDTGARGFIENGVLYFNQSDLSLDIQPASLWQPPVRPGAVLSYADRSEILLQAACKLVANSAQRKEGFYSLLAERLDIPVCDPGASVSERSAFRCLLDEWKAATKSGVITPGLSPACLAFLGLGRGLTPSGDDLVAGLLLALNRWGGVLAPGFPVEVLNRDVLSNASHATTLLSDSLLRCAAAGQADERLVSALDGLATGQPDPETVAERLKGYGSSSGFDTLVGFSIVLI